MSADPIRLRDATEADAPALLAIYAPFVRDTAVSWETEPPTEAEFAARIAKARSRWAWLVAEETLPDGRTRILGYAYGSQHRERAAYRFDTEVSVYLDAAARGRGLGRRLYAALFERLAALGYCNAFAGIALPNEASIGLHAAVGFEPVGVFRRAGWKFGRWHDIQWMQRPLREVPIEGT